MTDILMPALSPTMEEGKLIRWLVGVGDRIKPGQVVLEIETDKATMEVEAVDEGVLSEILVPEGSEGVKVNSVLARIGGERAQVETPAPAPVTAPAPSATEPSAAPEGLLSPSARRVVHESGLDPASIVGSGRAGRITKGDALAAAAAASVPARADVSPLAGRLALQLGVDLATLKGSGPGGRILRVDVAPPSSAPPRTGRPAAAEPRQALSLEQMGIAPGSYDLIPLDGMRKTVARRMTDSFRDVPHFPLTLDIELDNLLAARSRINAMLEKQGGKVSVNDLVMKAAAVALKQVPEANASYTPDGIAMHHHADIAMAVAVPGGLITPIIRQAELKGVAQIAQEAKDLAERARNKKLKPEEYQGGTFSVSNLGMFGIKSFASILNEPQGCILSVGAGEKRPVVRGDQLAIATVMSVTLTCDHRVVDGAVGARFLAAFKALIDDPITMIV